MQQDFRFSAGRRPVRAARLAAVLALLTGPLSAQTAVIEETAPPPRGARSAEVETALALDGAETGMTYVTRMTGDLAEGRTEVMQPEKRPEDRAPLPRNGSVSTVMVVLLLLGGLLLWLRFGGAGMLMSRAPQAQRKPVAAPEGWNISAADQTDDPRRLLEQIAAMPDRAAALVRLLRHCLLTAAGETDTRLARADTERAAFRRLPQGWRGLEALRGILTRTELAHYGGRPVAEAEFAATLELGRGILLRGRAAHA